MTVVQNEKIVFTFERLPESLEEFTSSKEASLQNPFMTAALTVIALNCYETNPDVCFEMLAYLKGPSSVSEYEKQFIRDRIRGKGYVVRSFFEGTSVQNQYSIPFPAVITVFTNLYSYQEENYANLYIQSSGADSPRSVKMRLAKDGKWYLWEQYLLSDIRVPAKEDPWA